ncbi:V0/A0 complex, 116-kDa subunit of ATPase [Wallemia mellicola]|nr:V0/A0 complex, 116-kDa subunit of ATPase [Wallemia mellicola]
MPPALFRSEDMSLVQFYVPTEIAHDSVLHLGDLGLVQFRDLNPDLNPFQRSFTNEIRRIDEMERRLRFFIGQIYRDNVKIREIESQLDFDLDQSIELDRPHHGPQLIDDIDDKLIDHEGRLTQLNKSFEKLSVDCYKLEEARQALKETASFFNNVNGYRDEIRSSFDDVSMHDDSRPLLDNDNQSETSHFANFELDFVVGTIDRSKLATFERILWRVLRGNLYMNHTDMQEITLPYGASSEENPKKSVFIIFADGQELLNKIRKVGEGMGAATFPVSSNSERRTEALSGLNQQIEDIHTVLYHTAQSRRSELAAIATDVATWSSIVRKEKTVYATLNLFHYDDRHRTLLAEGWVPSHEIIAVQQALRRASSNVGSNVPPIVDEIKAKRMPPTYHRTNKFTQGFQNIVDAYGIATYQEVNPGLYTIITFPFLFAVMFGDIGHGILVFLTALGMVYFEKKLMKKKLDEMTETIFGGRYIILLMGAFAIYTGLLYNDMFSRSLHIFTSSFEFPAPSPDQGSVIAEKVRDPYIFGLDPAWHGSENSLVFTNSMKMKMSIVIGVIHMSFAICLNIPNYLREKKPQYILAEWLPQILFLNSIFGYLVLCIIIKWCTDWNNSSNGPPGLLNMLIYMFLSPGKLDPKDQLFKGQGFIQLVLLLVAFVCVPWMLVAKPYLEWKEHQRTKGAGYGTVVNDDHRLSLDEDAGHDLRSSAASESGDVDGHDEHEFELGDVAIHQIIHTIEFVLGCISNTASYLRLWALSLAHAQLSEVLWNMILEPALDSSGLTGIIALALSGTFWFILTVAILCMMEGMSAFLHALRLHWVEANGKHYKAEGYAFEPLKFEPIDLENF